MKKPKRKFIDWYLMADPAQLMAFMVAIMLYGFAFAIGWAFVGAVLGVIGFPILGWLISMVIFTAYLVWGIITTEPRGF